MATLKQFQKRMGKLSNVVSRNSAKAVRSGALIADQVVVSGTPVNEGRARSNWLASLNAPSGETIEPYAPGANLGVNEGGNLRGALEQGVRVIAKFKPGAFFKSIHITNNLPYIVSLNAGSSAQAPAGFVEEAIAAARREVKRVKLLKA